MLGVDGPVVGSVSGCVFKTPGPSPLAALHARRLTTARPGQALLPHSTPKNTLRRTPQPDLGYFAFFARRSDLGQKTPYISTHNGLQKFCC